MKVPYTHPDILAFAKDRIGPQCFTSLSRRLAQYSVWQAYMDAGAEEASRPSIYNKCGPHIERTGGFLFSPLDVRFMVQFGPGADPVWTERSVDIARALNEEYHGTGADLEFSDAVDYGLLYGAAFTKKLWKGGIETFLVLPSNMGVYREDVNGLERQQAIGFETWLTRADLAELLVDHPNRAEIMSRVSAQPLVRDDVDNQNLLHQVIISGTAQAGGLAPTGGQARGVVDVFNTSPTAMLDPEVRADLVKLTELWVKDDDRQDWTTIQYVEPGLLIEPYQQKRNTFLKGRQPFSLVQPNKRKGYFWGRSELTYLWRLQDIITTRLDDIEHITRLRAHPPRAFIGFAGLGDESKAAIGNLDGMLVEPTPNAKIENLAPEMPQDAYANLDKIVGYYDDVAGFTPLMSGQGETGVRSNSQSTTLSRAGMVRMRKAALGVERQCNEDGDLFLELLIAKDPGALVRRDRQGHEYLLSQMPPDRTVRVESHSASPVFAMDETQLAFALARAGAVDEEGLLLLTHPPQVEKLLQLLAKKKAEQAQMMKDNPELFAKLQGGRRRR